MAIKATVVAAKNDYLGKLIGILSYEEAEIIKEHIEDSRKKTDEKIKKIAERLSKD